MRLLMLLVHQEAYGLRALQQVAAQLRKTACAVALTALIRMNVDAFKVNDIRRFTHDVGIEDQSAILDPHPYPALLDAAQPAQFEARRIYLQRIDSAFLTDHFCVQGQNNREVVARCLAQTAHVLKRSHRRLLLKQQLATNATRCASRLREVAPKGGCVVFLAQDHMRGVTILREARESCEGSFAPRFDKCEMTDLGDAFEPPLPVTVGVEGPAIEFALQPVIVYEPGARRGKQEPRPRARRVAFGPPTSCRRLKEP